MLQYDEKQLAGELEQLAPAARAGFAAACAERLIPAYISFSRHRGRTDHADLGDALVRLWTDLTGGPTLGEAVLTELIDRCEDLVPSDEDKDWSAESAYAQNAAAAVAYALRCRAEHASQEAVWAARQAYEAIDQSVIDRDHVDVNVPHVEEIIRRHPLIQAELQRQRQDLSDLRSDQPDFVRIRQRARRDGEQLFGEIRS
jgi:uncharacterized protein YjaG (DUF416 family)